MVGMESIEVQVGRLDERLMNLDQKVEMHNEMSMVSHANLAEEVRRLSGKIEIIFDRYDEKLQQNSKSIDELKRDRTWMFGVFSILWATIFAYFKHKLGGSD